MITYEEHKARAMLLGMYYRPDRQWYSDANMPGVHWRDVKRYDCVTLEVITEDEFERRVGIARHDRIDGISDT